MFTREPASSCIHVPGFLRAAVMLGLVAVTHGCAYSQEPQPIRTDLVIAVERADNVPPGSIFLKPIPGGFLGRTTDAEMFRSRVGGQRIEIPLAALSASLDDHAVRVRSDAFNPGELADPRDVRIARVGTFYAPVSRNPHCNNFRTGLRGNYPASTMLVYVDRAATVRGARYAAPYIMNYELEFPEAGLYAVEMRTLGMVVTQRVVGAADAITARVRRVPCR